MLPPRRSTMVETGDHPPLTKKLAAVAASPSRIRIMVSHLGDSITTITRAARNQGVSDRSCYRQCLRRQRRRDKHRAEFEDEQGGQARISDPILPCAAQPPSVVKHN